jgi:hypothetical protein
VITLAILGILAFLAVPYSTMKIFASLIIVASCFAACTKDIEENQQQTDAVLSADSSVIHLANSSRAIDSFEIKAQGDWTLTTEPANVNWFTLSDSSGSGNARIFVRSANFNIDSAGRSATIIIQPKDNSSSVVTIKVEQSRSTFSHWSHLFGISNEDVLDRVLMTPDGGYLSIGVASPSFGQFVSWIVKTDAQGNKIWDKTYGDVNMYFPPKAVTPQNDGYILYGIAQQPPATGIDSTKDLWMYKIDENGDIQSQKKLSTVTYGNSDFTTISSGGFIFFGFTQEDTYDGDIDNDIRLIRLDADGNMMWDRRYAAKFQNRPSDIIETADGGFIIAGYTDDYHPRTEVFNGTADAWIFKVDKQGNVEWQKEFGGSKKDQCQRLIATSDGGLLLACRTTSNDGDVSEGFGNEDTWLIKLDANHNVQWKQVFGGPGQDYPGWLMETGDGNYLVSGVIDCQYGGIPDGHGIFDAWVAKLDSQGQVLWQHLFGGSESDGFNSILAVGNNQYIAVGSSWSNDGDVSDATGGLDGWMMTFEAN